MVYVGPYQTGGVGAGKRCYHNLLLITSRNVCLRLGASTDDLRRGEVRDVGQRLISGSVLSGRWATEKESYLGRYHLQVSVIAEDRSRAFLGWLLPTWGQYSATTFFSHLFRNRTYELTTALHGKPTAMVPLGTFERVMPLDILPTQLLRALLVGDTDMAQALGCLELDEEDLALCSFLCPSKCDYGTVLRSALTQIALLYHRAAVGRTYYCAGRSLGLPTALDPHPAWRE